MEAFKELSKLISMLPGVGPKSATRIASFILKSSDEYTLALSNSIQTIKQKITPCPECGAWMENNNCEFCNNAHDTKKICVVETPEDAQVIQESRSYSGHYHILGGRISPLNGVYPENLRFDSLVDRANKLGIKEIIIATNPNEEGEITAHFIKNLFKDYKNIEITRISSGIATGSNITFAPDAMINHSFANRIKF